MASVGAKVDTHHAAMKVVCRHFAEFVQTNKSARCFFLKSLKAQVSFPVACLIF